MRARFWHLIIDFASWRAKRASLRVDFWMDVVSALAYGTRFSDVRRRRKIRECSNYECEAVDLDLLARN